MRAIPFKVAQKIGDGDSSWIPQWTGISVTRAPTAAVGAVQDRTVVLPGCIAAHGPPTRILALWWLWC